MCIRDSLEEPDLRFVAQAFRPFTRDLEAVSYTHLDVYKRQALSGGTGNPARGIISERIDNMSESCGHDCGSCQENCAERDPHAKLGEFSSIKKVVAVSSGKGGVGKSSVTAMLAVLLSRRGLKVGVLDADITGPSIPRAFGIKRKARGSEMGILPEETAMGIKVMSINLLLEHEDQPVVWRGPILAGAVTQFWTAVALSLIHI